jgi:hypothetical protein
MVSYTLDLAPKTYAKDGKHELHILMVCDNSAAHPDNAPFFNTQKPVEVELKHE